MKIVRYADYARYSIEESGSSIDEQHRRNREYAHAMSTSEEEWVEAGRWEDKVSGAKTTNRPGYLEMMAGIDRWDVMIVAAIDRAHRDTLNFLLMTETLKSKGKHFISLTERIDTSGPYGEVLLKLFAVLAEFERAKIKERSKRGHSASKARGFRTLRRMPIGFGVVETRTDGSRVVEPLPNPVLINGQQARRHRRLVAQWKAAGPWIIAPPKRSRIAH